MSLQELVAICAPPASPVAADGDWMAVEAELGIELPQDFKLLIATYGAGTFGDFIVVHSPFRRDPKRRLVQRAEAWLVGQRALRLDVPADFADPLHPEPGGLLPWGVTDNGDVCCWLTDGTSDSWTIAINESRGSEWHRTAGPLTTFLAVVLRGRASVSVFPDDFPPPAVTFLPVPGE